MKDLGSPNQQAQWKSQHGGFTTCLAKVQEEILWQEPSQVNSSGKTTNTSVHLQWIIISFSFTGE